MLWACVVSLDEPGGARRACATGSISIHSVNLYTVLCSCGGKAGFSLVRGTVREVCHFKYKMCSDSLGMGMCCPVRRISKDARAAVCRGLQSVIPRCSPATQGPKKFKKNILRKGLWRPGGNTGVSKVQDFAGELCSSCSECWTLAVCSMSPQTGAA